LAGCFQVGVHENGGWGGDYLLGNVAYAAMTRQLEDRPVVADLWPGHPLIWGAVFANPKWITDEVRKLPRAGEIGVRWNVPVPPSRADDPTKVAVVWAQTGPDMDRLDKEGALTIQPAGDLRALDMVGHPIGRKEGDALTVPFTPFPVYLLSDQLSVVEMHTRIAGARIEGLTPVNSYLHALLTPLGDKPATLTARVQNQLNRPLKATLALAGPDGWKIEPAQRAIELQPAELVACDFRITATSPTARNQYVVTTTIESDAGKYERREIVAVACIQAKTIQVDGNVGEWAPGLFAHVDIEQMSNPERHMQWLADPSQPQPRPKGNRAFVGVDMALAYDNRYVYIAAIVHEPGLGNDTAGDPKSFGENPLTNGDCFAFVFAFDERAPDGYRQQGDPWYWKGMVRDTDYAVCHFRQRADQPMLLSLQVPGLTWRTDFRTERVNTFPVPRARARFVRDETPRTTTYEIALPRRYLSRFDPAKPYCRFGFVYFNDEKLPPLEWSRACGVFDYWRGSGSFLPTWEAFLACQTRWGILR
jgi:hypothetical protein